MYFELQKNLQKKCTIFKGSKRISETKLLIKIDTEKGCRRNKREETESFQSDIKRLKVKLPSNHKQFHNSAEIPDLLNANTKVRYNNSTSINLSPKFSEFEI